MMSDEQEVARNFKKDGVNNEIYRCDNSKLIEAGSNGFIRSFGW